MAQYCRCLSKGRRAPLPMSRAEMRFLSPPGKTHCLPDQGMVYTDSHYDNQSLHPILRSLCAESEEVMVRYLHAAGWAGAFSAIAGATLSAPATTTLLVG